MYKISQTYRTWNNRLQQSKLLFISLTMLGLTLGAIAPTQTVQAASCRQYDTAADTYIGSDQYNDPWYRADKTTVPSSSGCADINLTRASIDHLYGGAGCANFRVRFYPSSGGSYTNTPKLACTGTGSLVLASSVKNGTVYRIEADRLVSFHIFD